jgi:XTP/dITP diphosphohydrolase
MEIWIASSNQGKLKEFALQMKSIPNLILKNQTDLNGFTPRPEDGKTFLENARIKARTLKSVKSSVWVLGEDSGLEVNGLGNLPGIHTARYAGAKASDAENNAKLLKMLQIRQVSDRSARFVCSLVAFSPEGTEHCFEAEMKGKIAFKPIGLHGFGYDSVFIPNEKNTEPAQTLAELGPSYKIQHSHRAQVVRSFLEKLQSL